MFRFLGDISFRLQLVAGAVATLALIECSQDVRDIAGEWNRLDSQLLVRANLASDLLSQSVILPMWDFNVPVVQQMVSGLSVDQSVGGARLSDMSGEVIAEWMRPGTEPRPDDLRSSRAIVYIDEGKHEAIGHLEMRFPRAAMAREFRDFVIREVLLTLFVVLIAASALWVVLGRIMKPLAMLVDAIDDIRAGRIDVVVPGSARTDEIGRVAAALDGFRETQVEMRALRAERDAKNTRERHRMVRALQSTEDGVLLVDPDGRVVMQNVQAERYFGTVEIGACVTEALKDCAPDAAVALDRATSVDEVIRTQTSASQRDLRIRVDPILDEDGRSLGQVLLATDISEELRQRRRADFLATHDSLTGLPNRRAMEAALDDLVGRRGEVAVLLGDLDRFKEINDTLGHPVGDALLKHIGNMLRSMVAEGDIPVRLGGDEFAIVASGAGCCERLETYSNRLIDGLCLPQNVDGRLLQSGISIGIASGPPPSGQAAELIQMADLALYEAKKTGRGRRSIFHAELQRSAKRRKWVEDNLREALAEDGQLMPVFQAQTDLRTRRIIGFEALARWTHPKDGPISPAEFIPAAEESGLIEPLTIRILEESLDLGMSLCRAGMPMRIAVNLSPRLFDGRALEMISDALLQSGAPASCLEIEITEQVLLCRGDAARQEIEHLRALGVTVALDDFGMGYSSLSYLHRFPVDKIKIDRAFVADIANSRETRAIVHAIVELGHALGMTVTGEGAETEAERAGLLDCGADAVQGWVDGCPMSACDVRTLLLGEMSDLRGATGS